MSEKFLEGRFWRGRSVHIFNGLGRYGWRANQDQALCGAKAARNRAAIQRSDKLRPHVDTGEYAYCSECIAERDRLLEAKP